MLRCVMCLTRTCRQQTKGGYVKPKHPRDVRITTHLADVSDEVQVLAFRDSVMREQETDCVHLVFNNAGIGWRRKYDQ